MVIITNFHASFNGATTLKPWMAANSASRRSANALLQWGHDVEAVDGRILKGAFDEFEMLQWGYDVEAVDGHSAWSAALQSVELQWGHDVEAVDGWLT